MFHHEILLGSEDEIGELPQRSRTPYQRKYKRQRRSTRPRDVHQSEVLYDLVTRELDIYATKGAKPFSTYGYKVMIPRYDLWK